MKKTFILILTALAILTGAARAEVIGSVDKYFKLDATASTSGRLAGIHKVVGVGQNGAFEIYCGMHWLGEMKIAELRFFPGVSHDLTKIDLTDGQRLAEMELSSAGECNALRDRLTGASANQILNIDLTSYSSSTLSKNGRDCAIRVTNRLPNLAHSGLARLCAGEP